MSIVGESANSQSQLAGTLAAGVDVISSNQTITFTRYQRTVLPLDGYVFWINSGNSGPVSGSLHYATHQEQREDETIDISRVIFTATSPVQCLNEVSPSVLYVGTFQGIRFAFSRRDSFYQQSGLYHYGGDAVYPALASQLIDNTSSLLGSEPIVSNSLPIWLDQNSMAPVYPSFLVPNNIEPPYITAHINPDETIALQAFPLFDWSGRADPNTDPSPLYELPSWQLMRDTVRLTMYGFSNQQAIQFYASLMDYSVNTDNFGFCNSPSIMDDKRIQVELAALAMKKTLTIQASYYQGTADAVARRLILSAGFSSITTV